MVVGSNTEEGEADLMGGVDPALDEGLGLVRSCWTTSRLARACLKLAGDFLAERGVCRRRRSGVVLVPDSNYR